MLLFPLQLSAITSLSFCAYQDFVINPKVWLLAGIFYRLQIFPKAIGLALSEVVPRQA